jgi:uncharacterized membrane protein
MERPSKPQVATFVGVLSIYIGVRFWNLTTSCLWFDEIYSVHAAEHSWNTIFSFVALDLIHPPLFYALLKLWIAIGDESLMWLRVFPVVFAILAVVPFVLLCRELRLRNWATLLGVCLIAVNGSLIKYAQEVRMYSMLMCASLFAMWLFARYLRMGKGIAALAVVNVLLVYTHYFGWLVVLGEAIILCFPTLRNLPPSHMTSHSLNKRDAKAILATIGIPLICFAPWIVAALRAERLGSTLTENIGWMQRPGFTEIAQFVLNLIEPFYYSAISLDSPSVYRVSIPLLSLVAISLIVYFARFRSVDEKQRTSVKLLTTFVVLPLLFAFIASWILPYSIWGTRHLVIVFAAVSIIIANAFIHLPSFKTRTFALATVVLFAGYAFLIQVRRPAMEPIWCSFETLGREMEAERDSPIIVFEDLAAYHLWFAFRKDDQPAEIDKVQNFPGMTEDTAYFLPRGFNGVRKVSAEELNYHEMWVMYRSPTNKLAELPVTVMAEKGYVVVERKEYDFGYQKLVGVLLRR